MTQATQATQATIRTAVVTGAARGIGLATAQRLLTDGWRVALLDRDDAVLGAAESLGTPSARGYVADVASATDWAHVVGSVRADLGPVDALVSNALVTDRTPLHDMTPESWRRQLDVNLGGTFHGVRACLPDLRRDGDGRVVIVSSVHAAFGLPDVPAYATTKAGLTGLTRQLAVQYGGQVRVNCVLPGPIRTAQWDGVGEEDVARSAAETAIGRLGRPEEVAGAIVFLLGDDATYVTGSTLAVDGGWSISKNSS